MDATVLADWLKQRIRRDVARAEWRRILEGSVEACLDQPLSSLLPPSSVESAVLKTLESEHLGPLTKLYTRLVLPVAFKALREDQKPLGRWFSKDAKASLLELVSQEGIVDPEWVRTFMRQKASEELVADTLYAALKDFSQIVPRIVQSLTPAVVGKIAKLGGLGAGGLGSRLVEELEKRLEPEIKKFLQGGTRRALDGAARFAIEHLEDAASLESRRNITEFVLGESPAFHFRPFTERRQEMVRTIVEQVFAEVSARGESAEIAKTLIRGWYEAHGAKSIRALLHEFEVELRPPYDTWAELTWPVLTAAFDAPEMNAWIEGLSREIVENFQLGGGG